MKEEKIPKKEEKPTSIADTYVPMLPPESLFDKFEKALRMDQKGTPRSAIIAELDVSSATFYKWIKNPKYWSEQYQAKPDRLKRTTKEIITSIKKKDNSLGTVRGLLKHLELNEYELEFMYHYIEKRNSTEAILRTLPPDCEITRHGARLRGLKMMQRKRIRAGIDLIMQWELEGIHVTLANDIIGSLYRMAFYDPAMFIDMKDGVAVSRFRTIDDVPEEYRCCITGFKNVFHPKDTTKTYCEIQLVDRMAAHKELMQYANLYEDNNKGLKSLGEGLGKIADLIEKNKGEFVSSTMENVTPSKIKDS